MGGVDAVSCVEPSCSLFLNHLIFRLTPSVNQQKAARHRVIAVAGNIVNRDKRRDYDKQDSLCMEAKTLCKPRDPGAAPEAQPRLTSLSLSEELLEEEEDDDDEEEEEQEDEEEDEEDEDDELESF
ncbi:hypothetical protein EYF80_052217 [Liparis tanakae]|uniref:Uncharacterized protein n=1 Tax=Liparis tanakae TaxID=230148 RepID=A0A4Z2F9H9_9TELE|nr:hypothetical protein EYF80_052217 [Liparis tanakae]